MSDVRAVIEVARARNLARESMELVECPRVIACRWRHSVRHLPDTTIPLDTLVFKLRGWTSRRRVGRRTQSAVSAREGMVLLPAGSYGAWEFGSDVDLLHLYFPRKVITETARALDIDDAVSLTESLDLDDHLIRSLCREAAKGAFGGRQEQLFVDTLSLSICARLLVRHASSAAARVASRPLYQGGLAPWQTKRAIDLLAARLGEPVSLSELSSQVGLSPFHFARAFKSSTGLPPHKYLVNLRLSRARLLLETTRLPVTDISAQVGYDDPGYLARLFRKTLGVTPAEYRRQRLA